MAQSAACKGVFFAGDFVIETFYSNSYEFLRELLCETIRGERSASGRSPFDEHHVLVPSAAVADDLKMHFARAFGTACGIEFTYIGQWLAKFTKRSGAAQGSFLDDLDWMILSLLTDQEFLARKGCERLKHYVGEQNPASLCAFSQRLARLFTTYATYRLDWVLEWMGADLNVFERSGLARRKRERLVLEASADGAWQKEMWSEFASRCWGPNKEPWAGAKLLADVPERWRELLSKDPREARGEALHVFLPDALSPLALPFLQALSKTTSINVYCINPSSAYWFESMPAELFEQWSKKNAGAFSYLRRNASSERAQIERIWNFSRDPETASSLCEDDLQAPEAFGRRGLMSDASQLDPAGLLELRAADAAPQQQTMVYVNRGEDSVLHCLQQAILEDDPEKLAKKKTPGDESIFIVKAPGPAREVEALADWIQALIERTALEERPIQADDILVVTPDINAMAPVISAVLDNRCGKESIAYSIVGQSVVDVNSAAQAILAAGRFIHSRAERKDFEALLAYPITTFARGFGGVDLGMISNWLAAAGYRFGLNEAHARELVQRGLAKSEGKSFEGTLERALERLNLGAFARSEEPRTFTDVYASRGDELGGFSRVDQAQASRALEFLLGFEHALRRCCQAPRKGSARQWQNWTHALISELFALAVQSDEVLAFGAIVDETAGKMQRVLGDEGVDFETFWTMLGIRAKTGQTPLRSTGRVVFAPIDAFRWLPRRAIAVLGLNEGSGFPGVNRSEEFDLMQAECVHEGQKLSARRKGDRDSRRNNRNVFFDLLLSAREYFYCSYCVGNDAVEKNPSVVLQDLRQTLAIGLGSEEVVDRELAVRLAAQTAAFKSFDPSMRFAASRDAQAAQAVEAACRENYLARDALFLDESAVPMPQDGQDRSVSLTEFIEAFIYPDSWLLKALSISKTSAQTTADVSLEASFCDSLLQRSFSRDVLEQMKKKRSDEEILHALALNPAMGLESARISAVGAKVAEIRSGFKFMQEVVEQTTSSIVRFQDVLVESGCYRRLKLPALTVYEKKEDKARFVVLEAFSSTDLQRAFLRFLALASVDHDLGAYIVSFKSTDGNQGIYLRSAKQAQLEHLPLETIAVLMRIFEKHALHSPSMATKPFLNWAGRQTTTEMTNGAPIWLGRDDREAIQQRTQDLMSAVSGLQKLFEPAAGDAKKTRKASGKKKTPVEVFKEAAAAFD